MALVYSNGTTKNTDTGQIVGVGNLTGSGGNTQNTGVAGWTPTAAVTTSASGQLISSADPNAKAYAQSGINSSAYAQSQANQGLLQAQAQSPILASEGAKFNAGIMSQPSVASAVNNAVTSALPTQAFLGKATTAKLPEMKATNTNLAMNEFNKLYKPFVDPNTGKTSVIQPTTGKQGYLTARDIAAEQAGISQFESIQKRKPSTSADWALINNAIYGTSTPPLRGGTLPGAKGDGGVTDHVPPPEIQAPDGTIDQEKLATTAQQELDQTKKDLEAAIAESDAYNAATEAGGQAIGQQLGVVAPLLQGEALALDQQRALGAKTLEIKIARLDQKKTALKEEVAQYRQDQQQAFVNFMNLATKTGLSSKSMTPEMLKAFETQSKLTGIPASMYAQSLDAIYQSRIASEANESLKTSAELSKLNQKDTAVVDVGGRKLLVNSQTGETIKDLGVSGTTTNTEAPTIKSINGTDMQWNSATQTWEKAGVVDGSPVVDPQKVADAQSMITNIDELMGIKDNFGSIPTGVRSMASWIPESAASNFKIKLDSIIGAETLKNMGLIKGVLSNSDMELLKSASTGGLNVKLSPELFQKQIEKLRNAAQSVVNSPKLSINQVMYNDDGSLSGPGNDDSKHTGTYSYKNNDGTVHTGTIGEKYNDPTVKPKPNFSSVGSDTNKAAVSTLMTIPDKVAGGQCGHFVNQITGLGMGDSYQSKIAKMDPSITKPAPGMVFVMPYKNTGHTGFIVGIDGKNAIVKDSNYGLDEKIKTHLIPISNMTGFRALA